MMMIKIIRTRPRELARTLRYLVSSREVHVAVSVVMPSVLTEVSSEFALVLLAKCRHVP
jgi:hypothetical protein